LRQLKKVTMFLSICCLVLLIVALGAAAKHGQFESSAHHGHFLSKSVKMEYVSNSPDFALSFDLSSAPLHAMIFCMFQPSLSVPRSLAIPSSLSLPLLV